MVQLRAFFWADLCLCKKGLDTSNLNCKRNQMSFKQCASSVYKIQTKTKTKTKHQRRLKRNRIQKLLAPE